MTSDMSIKDKIEHWKNEVVKAEKHLEQCKQTLENLQAYPENHIYLDRETAESFIFEHLENKAYADCAGSYKRGSDEYRQEFIVDGVHYVGILTCEYNRHDKTYYYLDDSDFRVESI